MKCEDSLGAYHSEDFCCCDNSMTKSKLVGLFPSYSFVAVIHRSHGMNPERRTDSEAMEECCLLPGLLLVAYAVFFLLALETNSPRVALLPVSWALPLQLSTKKMHNNPLPSTRSIFPN